MRRLARVTVLALVALLPAGALCAAQARFFRIEGATAFTAGELDGLAVDSEGRLRMAPTTRVLADAEAPFVWSVALDAAGTVFVGTGNDGKIMKIAAGKATTFFDTSELQVTALAFGPDGKLYAGTSPDGKVYAIDASGTGAPFVDPEDKYIWSMGFDSRGRLWIGTGGDGGRLLRVAIGPGTAQPRMEAVFSDQETHIVSIAFDNEGAVLAGSSPGGIVYRISPAGRPSVLLNSQYREIKSIVPAPDGSVLVAAFGARTDDDQPQPLPAAGSPTAAAASAEVSVSESFTVIAPQSGAPAPGAGPAASPASPGGGSTTNRGAVLKISSTGEADVLWSSSEEAPYALLLDGQDVLVGTGPRGRLYRVSMDQSYVVLADFPGEQITVLQKAAAGEVIAATSNPGSVHAISQETRATGTFTSKILDALTASAWGQVRFEADIPQGARVEVRTRSGHTPAPDNTWSDWSPPLSTARGAANDRPDGRYLQVKVTLSGPPLAPPVLHTVVAAYLQHNLRPVMTALAVHPPGEVFQKPLSATGDVEILGVAPQDAPENKAAARQGQGSSSASPTAFSRRVYQKGFQTLSWRAEDGNDDTLTYDVTYRPIGARAWSVLREGLTDPVLAFDTQTLPNGRYVVKVTASDSASNPPATALSATLESDGFDIDNTPPTITARALPGSQPAIVAEVRDDQSVIGKVEFSVDGGRWFEVQPKDGIDDGLVESYDIVLPFGIATGNHVVVVRASDALDNAATASVVVTR